MYTVPGIGPNPVRTSRARVGEIIPQYRGSLLRSRYKWGQMILEGTHSRTIADKVRRFDYKGLNQLQNPCRET